MPLLKKEEKTCPILNMGIMAQPNGLDAKGLIVPQGQPQPANIAFSCMGERCKFWGESEKECKIVLALDKAIYGKTETLKQ